MAIQGFFGKDLADADNSGALAKGGEFRQEGVRNHAGRFTAIGKTISGDHEPEAKQPKKECGGSLHERVLCEFNDELHALAS